MQILLSDIAKEHYRFWIKINNTKIISKITSLIEDIQEHPFTGLGKPEPLKGDYSGYWSRRIDKEHRLIYKVENDTIIIMQCRFHY